MTQGQHVNNAVYRSLGHAWWDDEVGEFSSLRFWINPVRFGFFERVIGRERLLASGRPSLLDVGCGGGILAEEFARLGFEVTGIDPAPETIETARAHAITSGLTITYRTGVGEHLPFDHERFDHVVCCDVFEHVDDVDRVVGEIVRVLKPGGFVFYDTINRTLASWIAIIKVMQEWPATAFVAANSHVWEKFITPAELTAIFARHGLVQGDMRGIGSRRNPIAALFDLRRRARGTLSFKELGERLGFEENARLSASYMGYATKRI